MLGEGALPSLRHAWAHLLKPDARIIPQAATLKGCVLNSPHFDSYHHIDRVCGFDLSPMAALSHPLSYKDINFDISRSDTEICLSNSMEIYRWDFTQAPPPDFDAVVEFTAQKSGTGNAMMLWFDLDLTETIKFSTQDPHPQDHWRQVCQIIPHPKMLEAAQQYQLRASYKGYYNFTLSD